MANAVRKIIDQLREDIEKVDESHYWRGEFDGLKNDRIKQPRELEAENAWLRRAIAELRLDNLLLREAVRGSPSLYNN
jgi:putative transposase